MESLKLIKLLGLEDPFQQWRTTLVRQVNLMAVIRMTLRFLFVKNRNITKLIEYDFQESNQIILHDVKQLISSNIKTY